MKLCSSEWRKSNVKSEERDKAVYMLWLNYSTMKTANWKWHRNSISTFSHEVTLVKRDMPVTCTYLKRMLKVKMPLRFHLNLQKYSCLGTTENSRVSLTECFRAKLEAIEWFVFIETNIMHRNSDTVRDRENWTQKCFFFFFQSLTVLNWHSFLKTWNSWLKMLTI